MNIYIACDHAGVEYKNIVVKHISQQGHSVTDYGTNTTERVDYPEYAHKVCSAVLQEKESRGILLCGSGIGMSIYANRFKDIRAGLCTTEYQSKMTRMHNNANILCLGARVSGVDIVIAMVDIFLITEYEGGRHQKRVDMLDNIFL